MCGDGVAGVFFYGEEARREVALAGVGGSGVLPGGFVGLVGCFAHGGAVGG